MIYDLSIIDKVSFGFYFYCSVNFNVAGLSRFQIQDGCVRCLSMSFACFLSLLTYLIVNLMNLVNSYELI